LAKRRKKQRRSWISRICFRSVMTMSLWR